jgi:hypothetical protein
VRLIVEGLDDQYVMRQLLRARAPQQRFDFTLLEGVDNRRLVLRTFLMSKETIGLVLDANDSLAARWQSIRDCAAEFGYELPPSPDRDGTIAHADERPRFGIWLMPDNEHGGALEHFVRQLIGPEDRLMPHAEHAVEALPEKRFSSKAQLKAVIHTWLAWQERPGTPMGTAIAAGYLRSEGPLLDRFIDWIARLDAA